VRRRFPVEQPHALTVIRESIGEIAREAVVLRFGIKREQSYRANRRQLTTMMGGNPQPPHQHRHQW
jgi:hypothetical protein